MAQAAEEGRDVEPGYYVIAPGCKQEDFWRRKRLDADRWADISAALADDWTPVFCLGLPGDFPADVPGNPAIDLTGQTTLAQAALVMKHARAVVAIDNGLAHVAAALGVPTVVMFGATSETKNRPQGARARILKRDDLVCRPCQMTPKWEGCAKWKCMDFEPEAVAKAVAATMAPTGQ
jgi:ADP-heptose:LPS heptosyltransferase